MDSRVQWSGLTRALSAVMIAGAAVGSGCGDGEYDPAEGGEIEIAVTAQPDALDPALSYTLIGWEPMAAVYTPLLTYRHVTGAASAEVIPGLASDLPEISPDGNTYTLQLRDGLTYSDGTEVKAATSSTRSPAYSPFNRAARGSSSGSMERRSTWTAASPRVTSAGSSPTTRLGRSRSRCSPPTPPSPTRWRPTSPASSPPTPRSRT